MRPCAHGARARSFLGHELSEGLPVPREPAASE